MLFDKKSYIRKLAYKRIVKARQLASKNATIREFVLPKLNFNATDYTVIVDWNSCKLTPPPILRDLTNNELKLFVTKDSKTIIDLQKFPCHTQAVERCVKIVTEASSTACRQIANSCQDLSCLIFRISQIINLLKLKKMIKEL